MKVVQFDGVELHIDESNTLPTKEVAFGYGVSQDAVRVQKRRHSDELIKGTHYIEVWDDKFKRYVTRWTLDGVHMLGFFIKSERAKAFRKFTAKLLSEIEKGNVQVSAPNTPAGCPASDNMSTRISGYKGMLKRKQNEIDRLRWELTLYKSEVESLKNDKRKMLETTKFYEQMYEREKQKVADGEWIMVEHNLIDLVGALARHKEELDAYGRQLEHIAKAHKERMAFVEHLLEQLIKFHPKTKNVAETAKEHALKHLQDTTRRIK